MRLARPPELTDAIFRTKYNGRPTRHLLYHWFRAVLFDAGIGHGGKGTGPRVHDLRHTFCTQALRKLLREGYDINVALPILASYVGHSSIKELQYYLHFDKSLFPEELEKIESYCQDVLPAMPEVTV
jgi:integrase